MSNVQVTIWDKVVEISVQQKSKTLWVASGEYLEQSFMFQGRSQSVAAKTWAEAVRDYANRSLSALLVRRPTRPLV